MYEACQHWQSVYESLRLPCNAPCSDTNNIKGQASQFPNYLAVCHNQWGTRIGRMQKSLTPSIIYHFKSVYTIAANWALATPPPFQTLIRFSCLRVSVPAVSGECGRSVDFGGYGTCVWVWNRSDRRCQKKRWGDACSRDGCWQIKMFQSSPFGGVEIQSGMEERKTETSGILHEAMLSPSDGIAKTK